MEDPPIYKLKGIENPAQDSPNYRFFIVDWPTTDDICRKMPLHFKAFKEFLPCHEICHRDGALNLAKYLPKYFCIPDLGPKMYIAYGWLEEFIDKNKHEVFLKMKQVSFAVIAVELTLLSGKYRLPHRHFRRNQRDDKRRRTSQFLLKTAATRSLAQFARGRGSLRRRNRQFHRVWTKTGRALAHLACPRYRENKKTAS